MWKFYLWHTHGFVVVSGERYRDYICGRTFEVTDRPIPIFVRTWKVKLAGIHRRLASNDMYSTIRKLLGTMERQRKLLGRTVISQTRINPYSWSWPRQGNQQDIQRT